MIIKAIIKGNNIDVADSNENDNDSILVIMNVYKNALCQECRFSGLSITGFTEWREASNFSKTDTSPIKSKP